jgi:uncharacterized protein
MSQQNVDLVRTVFEAFDRADMVAVAGMLHPDVELTEHFELSTSPGPHRGLEGLLAWYRDGGQNWSVYEIKLIEAVPVGNDVVLAVGDVRATGRTSGIEMTHRFGYLYTIAEGKIIRFEIFNDRAEALAAVNSPE